MNDSMMRKMVKSAVIRIGGSFAPMEIQSTSKIDPEMIKLARRLSSERGYELEVRRTDPNRLEFWKINPEEICFAFTCL